MVDRQPRVAAGLNRQRSVDAWTGPPFKKPSARSRLVSACLAMLRCPLRLVFGRLFSLGGCSARHSCAVSRGSLHQHTIQSASTVVVLFPVCDKRWRPTKASAAHPAVKHLDGGGGGEQQACACT